MAAVLGLFASLGASAALSFAMPCCSRTGVREEEDADTWLVSQPPPSARARTTLLRAPVPVSGGRGRRRASEEEEEAQLVCTMCLEVLGDVRRRAVDEEPSKNTCPMCAVPGSEPLPAGFRRHGSVQT